jgi:hypothetical protein
VAHDEEFVVLHFVEAILALREDEAVSLTVHGLGAESGSDKVNLLLSVSSKRLGEVKQLNLNAHVLLGSDAFSLCAVVVSAGLVVELGEDGVAFAVLDFVVGLEVGELPAHK